MSLTLLAKQAPLPWAGAAIAAYSPKTEIAFDDEIAALTFTTSDGTTITDEDAVVQAIAQESGLAEDSAKVRRFSDLKQSSGITSIRVRPSMLWERL